MKQYKVAYLSCYIFALVLMLCAGKGYTQDLNKAKELCDNITAQNKAMAKHAGYDLDALCSEVSSMESLDTEDVQVPKVVKRETASSSKGISGSVSPDMDSETSKKESFSRDSSDEDSESMMDAEDGETDSVILIEDEDEVEEEEQPLKPFGYDLFANSPTTFAPASSIAVSNE